MRRPRRKQKLLWPRLTEASFNASRTSLANFRHTRAFADLHHLMRKELYLDCALRWPDGWRLERVELRHSQQFRLYKGRRLIGVVGVELHRVREQYMHMAAYILSAYGLTAANAWPGAARTAFEAYEYNKHELKAG